MDFGNFLSNVDKQQYLQTFLHIVRGSKSKNDFMKNVQQFDNKFTEAYQGPQFQNKASYESFQSVQQIQPPQKPKNPFINQNQQNVKRNYSPSRSNNFMTQQQQPPAFYNQNNNMLSNNQNRMNVQPSRTEQDFFKPPQAAKTFHAGFTAKEYERPMYNQQFTAQIPPKGPNFAWQNSDGFNQPNGQYAPPNYYQQEMKQNYNEMMNKFNNFAVNDQQKYSSYNNELLTSSRQNLPPINSGLDAPPNQFLAAFSKDDEGVGKYYKAPIPYPPKQEIQNSRPYMEKRGNPFGYQ